MIQYISGTRLAPTEVERRCGSTERSGRMEKQIDIKQTGKWLRFLCRMKRIPVKEICRELCLSCPQSVYAWFNGKTLPSLDNFYALSQMLGMTMDGMLVNRNAALPDTFMVNENPLAARILHYAMAESKAAVRYEK